MTQQTTAFEARNVCALQGTRAVRKSSRWLCAEVRLRPWTLAHARTQPTHASIVTLVLPFLLSLASRPCPTLPYPVLPLLFPPSVLAPTASVTPFLRWTDPRGTMGAHRLLFVGTGVKFGAWWVHRRSACLRRLSGLVPWLIMPAGGRVGGWVNVNDDFARTGASLGVGPGCVCDA